MFHRAFASGILACLLCSCTHAPMPAPSPILPPTEAIRAEPATLRTLQDRVVAAGNLTADPGRQSLVGTPASGRLTEVYAQAGDSVVSGQPLARLHSAELTRARAERDDALVRLQLASRTLEQRRQQFRLGDASQRPVEEAQNELAAAQGDEQVTRSALDLQRRKLRRARDLLEHGVLPRQELEEAAAAEAEARSRWDQARKVLAVASHHHRRESRLAAGGSLVQTKILEAESEYRLASEELAHKQQLLRDFGDPDGSGLLLRAPRSGIVVSSQARLGQSVAADQQLFEILDPTRLWLSITLYESDQSRVRLGMPVSIEVPALPGRTFAGRLAYLPPQVELPSRSLHARVLVHNPQASLKVGMAARVTISLGPKRQAVTIPSSALLANNVVYVDRKPRTVEPGSRDGDWVEVRKGLKAGELVVTQGAYLLQESP